MAQQTQTNGIADLERVFSEYRERLESAQQQAETIIQQAREEAVSMKAAAEAEAARLLEAAESKVQGAADDLLKRASDQAARITSEAETRAKKEAKQKVRREMEKIITEERALAEKEAAETLENARREAAQIVAEQREMVKLESRTEALEIIARAREKARQLDEDSIIRAHETDRLLVDVVTRCQGVIAEFKQQATTEFGELESVVTRAQDNLKDMILAGEVAATKSTEADLPQGTVRLFKGLQEIRVLRPYRRGQIDELIRALCQFPRVRLSWESGSADYIALNIEIGEPLPLLGLLGDLPLVLEYEVRGSIIEIKLNPMPGR